jgi:UDP-glucose 4-epimerase
MTILVTGSAGHLGEGLMRTLRRANRRTLGLDIRPSPLTDCVGSICDREFVRRSMRGVRAVIHAATLHKPHLATHDNQAFLDTNVTGTLRLLEEAVHAGVEAFVFTSTTSAFGSALTPAENQPAAWVTEDVAPIARNIYGVSKVAAESLCELFSRRDGLPVIVLRTSRFFPEADDNATVRRSYTIENAQANEMLYRRVDLQDAVDAHLLAIDKAPDLGFRRYIISAMTPFVPDDLAILRHRAPDVVHRLFPACEPLFAARQWTLFPEIDRVYVSRLAMTELGWRPKYDFHHVLEALRGGIEFRSPLAREIGSKGYHEADSYYG